MPTSVLTTLKLLFNSVISTPLEKFLRIDIKHFYLCTPLDRHEYMRLPLAIIPDEIIKKYNILSLEKYGWVYIKIKKGMYGLPQAVLLANKLPEKRLPKHRYLLVQYTPGL